MRFHGIHTWEQFQLSAQAAILYNTFENHTYKITAMHISQGPIS